MTVIRTAVFAVILFFWTFFFGSMSVGCSYAGTAGGFVDWTRTKDPRVREFSVALAHYIMGSIHDNFGNTETAIEEYNKVLLYRDDISEVYLKLGAGFLFLGKLDKAQTVLEKTVELDPENIKSYLLLAVIYTTKGEFQKAQAQHEEALKYDPGNLKVLTFLSDLFVIQQKFHRAAEIYEKILQTKKDEAFLYLNLGIIYSKLNLLDKAEKNLEKAIEMDQDYLEAQMVLGFIYEIDSKYAEAIKQYQKVIKIDPSNTRAHVRLGQLYYRVSETDKAVEQNRILMSLEEASPAPYIRNFSIYISEKRYDEAEEVLKEALKNGISAGIVYASLGYLAGVKEDYKKAVDYYYAALEKEPENDMYRFYLAMFMDRSGQTKKTIEILEEIVSRGKNIPEVFNYLGYLYAEQGRNLDQAVVLLEKAVSMEPTNGAYIDSLGWAYYKKGMIDKALVQMEKAVKYLPRDAVVREHLGDVYFAKGELRKAAKEWKLSLELDPANKEIKRKLKRIKK